MRKWRHFFLSFPHNFMTSISSFRLHVHFVTYSLIQSEIDDKAGYVLGRGCLVIDKLPSGSQSDRIRTSSSAPPSHPNMRTCQPRDDFPRRLIFIHRPRFPPGVTVLPILWQLFTPSSSFSVSGSRRQDAYCWETKSRNGEAKQISSFLERRIPTS